MDLQRENEREAALAWGAIADILQARGQLDEALRIRQEEQIPVFERLQARRSLLLGRANLALIYLERALDGDRARANELLCLALSVAEELRIPEAAKIRSILAKHGLSCKPGTDQPR